jgi:hypothetical protein
MHLVWIARDRRDRTRSNTDGLRSSRRGTRQIADRGNSDHGDYPIPRDHGDFLCSPDRTLFPDGICLRKSLFG